MVVTPTSAFSRKIKGLLEIERRKTEHCSSWSASVLLSNRVAVSQLSTSGITEAHSHLLKLRLITLLERVLFLPTSRKRKTHKLIIFEIISSVTSSRISGKALPLAPSLSSTPSLNQVTNCLRWRTKRPPLQQELKPHPRRSHYPESRWEEQSCWNYLPVQAVMRLWHKRCCDKRFFLSLSLTLTRQTQAADSSVDQNKSSSETLCNVRDQDSHSRTQCGIASYSQTFVLFFFFTKKVTPWAMKGSSHVRHQCAAALSKGGGWPFWQLAAREREREQRVGEVRFLRKEPSSPQPTLYCKDAEVSWKPDITAATQGRPAGPSSLSHFGEQKQE